MKNKKRKLQYAWLSDLKTYLEAMELAKKHGKKPGDNFQKEIIEIMEKKPKKFYMLGMTDMDLDMIVGNLREKGLRILNPNELNRRKTNKQ